MSADNGIYILVNPERKGGVLTGRNEYRVSMCSAIDNIDTTYTHGVTDDAGVFHKLWAIYETLLFETDKVHYDKISALKQASDIEEDMIKKNLFIEYGIRTLYRDHPFPDLSHTKAMKLRDEYYVRSSNPGSR
jgi:hypothetical protein